MDLEEIRNMWADAEVMTSREYFKKEGRSTHIQNPEAHRIMELKAVDKLLEQTLSSHEYLMRAVGERERERERDIQLFITLGHASLSRRLAQLLEYDHRDAGVSGTCVLFMLW
ncbi:hypothetical protein C0J52_22636 [Blattella germanica]|nr:hypothetical protein C0J52_22636 [Blattella germanica]